MLPPTEPPIDTCNAPRLDRWLLAIAACFVLFKLWLVSGQLVVAVAHANHDDALFLDQARHILGGRWLGPYSEFTLAKGPMYPLFIAGSFLLGLPLFTAQHLLYLLSCILLVAAIRPLAQNRWFLFTLFLALLFNPVTYDTATHARVLRQDILPALVLMIVAATIGLHAHRSGPIRSLLAWALVLGSALPAFWLTREEGVWLLPYAGLAWTYTAFAIWRERKKARSLRLTLLALPLLLWGLGIGTVATINHAYYGVFTTCEFRQTEFKDAYGALMRPVPDVKTPYVPITRKTRERLYEVSPTFAQLRPQLEGPLGEAWASISETLTHIPAQEREIASGWLMWALRGAVVASGHGHTSAEAMAFYARMADEINSACDRGFIQAGKKRSGFLPPLHREEYRAFLKSYLHSLWFFVTFTDLSPVKCDPSSGSPADLEKFRSYTRARLSPSADEPPVPKKQAWLDGIRTRLLEHITRFYQAVVPWLVCVSIAALLYCLIVMVRRRNLSFFFVVSLGLLGSNLALGAIVALIDATAFPSILSGYFTGGYALWLLFVFVSWTTLRITFTQPSLSSHPPATKP